MTKQMYANFQYDEEDLRSMTTDEVRWVMEHSEYPNVAKRAEDNLMKRNGVDGW